jgi:hypothetical protein
MGSIHRRSSLSGVRSASKVLVLAFALSAVASVASASSGLASAQARLIWSARYDGPAHGDDSTIQDVVSPDGSKVFVTGASPGINGDDLTTVAYATATGAKLWFARYDGSAHGDDSAWGVTITPNGSTVVVTGQSGGAATGFDFVTIGYNATTGALLWQARYDGPAHGNDNPIALQTSPDGALVFVSGTSIGVTGEDFLTLAYNTDNGSPVWIDRYDGPGHGNDSTGNLDVGPTGVVYIMGGSLGVGTAYDLATVAYNPLNGHRLWVARYDGPLHSDENSCILTCVEASADGARVYVLGQTPRSGTGQDIVTISYNATTGVQAWAKFLDSPTHGDDFPGDLAVLPDSSAVVSTGGLWGGTFYDLVTASYAAAGGTQQWRKVFDGQSHGEDYGNTIVATPNSQTVVLAAVSNSTGSNDPAGNDALTQAYATSDGSPRWSARYDSPAHAQDDGWFVSLSPDGTKAYTCGDTTGASGSLDYLTLAYRVT